MTHRFLCQQCGLKWFVQEDETERALTECASCAGQLIPYIDLRRAADADERGYGTPRNHLSAG